jgi:hypothetical protein
MPYPTSQSCANCQYVLTEPQKFIRNNALVLETITTCHVNPPTSNDFVWPVTDPTDWCSYWHSVT